MQHPDRSHHRWALAYLPWIIAILLLPAPAAVAVLILVFGWLEPHLRRTDGRLPGLLIWGPLAIAGALALVSQNGLADAGLLASAALLAGLTTRPFRMPHTFFGPLLLAQLLILGAVGIEHYQSRSMWRSVGTQHVSTDIQARFGGVQTIKGSNGPSWDDARRWWRVLEYGEVGTGEGLGVLEFDARSVAGTVGWWWSPGGTRVSVHEWRNDEDGAVTSAWIEVEPGEDRSTYVRRTYPIDQMAFSPNAIYYSIHARAHAIGREACAVLVIQTDRGTSVASQTFCVDDRGTTLAGTIPLARFADAEALDVVFTRIDDDLILGEATVTATGTSCIGSSCTPGTAELQSNQIGLAVRIGDGTGAVHGRSNIVPHTDWATHRVPLLRSTTSTSPTELLTAHLKVEPGIEVEVRGASLRTIDAAFSAHPYAGTSAVRARLTSPHPNLLGHAVALVAIAFLVGKATLPVRIAGFTASTAVILATGSRAALVVVLGAAFWTWFRHRKERSPDQRAHSTTDRRWASPIVATAIIATTIALLMGLDSFARTTTGAPSRIDIWSAAASAIGAHPWFGLAGAGESFATYWQEHHAIDHAGISVSHAHNFVLDVGSRHGVVAAIAALLAMLGVVAWARTRAPRAGTVLGMAVVFLNLFDSTLLNSHVIVPFVVLVEALRSGDRT